MRFSNNSININPETETNSIVEKIRHVITKQLKKRGVVIGLSGGIDSSVVLALCARALKNNRVLGISLPEKDSSPDNEFYVNKLLEIYRVPHVVEDITGALEGFAAYQRRDRAIKRLFPEYNSSYQVKIVLKNDILTKSAFNFFNLSIIAPNKVKKTVRLPVKEYLEIVAASNFKQRCRMSMLYYHAERLNYAVVGTGNKNEHELGFFVKWGDGGADLKPIQHLFKSQVYQLAKYLEIPEEIQRRTPTTDTYSAEQTQEEFFFRCPFAILDSIWYGWEHGVPIPEIAYVLNLSPDQVENVIDDVKRKMTATNYLRLAPL